MDHLTTVKHFEEVGLARLGKVTREYYAAGANGMISLKDNVNRFDTLKLKSKAGVDPDKFEGLQTETLGIKIPSPICIASTSFHKLAYYQGEAATARGAGKTNTPFMLSNWANTPVEVINECCPNSLKMFQIYMSKMPEVNEDLWRRVRESDFKFMMLTTDTQLMGKRENDVRNSFELPSHLKLENLTKYNSTTETSLKATKGSGLMEYAKIHKNNEIGWDIIPYIKKVSGLKVFAKGVMCYEDAKLAIQNGADGVYVSNHGARQLDTTPATIDVLPEVVRAVREVSKTIPVYFDGGVRKGSDVLKALALGADVVFLGRAALWGLSANGQEGVERVLEILNQELKEAMITTGCMNVAQARNNSDLILDNREYLFKL